MASLYLQGADLAAYGVAAASTAQIQAASAVVDAYLNRPEGVVWVPDATGAPAYMAGLSPGLEFTAPGPIAPGANVVIPVTGYLSSDLVGEVLILDRGNSLKTEACVVSAIAAGTLTLATVALSHVAGTVMEGGLTILEERALPAKRPVTRVSRSPVVRLISGMGRYAYGRRSDQTSGFYHDLNLLSAMQAFGGPPLWAAIDMAHTNVSPATGEVWIPAGQLIAYYTDVRLRYVAGWKQANLPTAIKQATANVVGSVMEFPEISGNFKKVQAGGTAIERFKDTVLDSDSRDMLTAFVANLLF